MFMTLKMLSSMPISADILLIAFAHHSEMFLSVNKLFETHLSTAFNLILKSDGRDLIDAPFANALCIRFAVFSVRIGAAY